jgi:hypothetical protein
VPAACSTPAHAVAREPQPSDRSGTPPCTARPCTLLLPLRCGPHRAALALAQIRSEPSPLASRRAGPRSPPAPARVPRPAPARLGRPRLRTAGPASALASPRLGRSPNAPLPQPLGPPAAQAAANARCLAPAAASAASLRSLGLRPSAARARSASACIRARARPGLLRSPARVWSRSPLGPPLRALARLPLGPAAPCAAAHPLPARPVEVRERGLKEIGMEAN